MSTIAQQLEALADIKEAIRQAIIAKGVTVASDAAFGNYATAIGQISGGGGGSTLTDMIERDVTTIAIPSDCTKIGGNAFAGYGALTSIVIPDNVLTIDGYAFNDCRALTTIDIGSGCTYLKNYCFTACKAVTTIICRAATPPTTYANTFGSGNNYTGRTNYTKGTNKLYVPYGKSSDYSSSGYFASVLLDSTKCGFTIAELDSNGNIPT